MIVHNARVKGFCAFGTVRIGSVEWLGLGAMAWGYGLGLRLGLLKFHDFRIQSFN